MAASDALFVEPDLPFIDTKAATETDPTVEATPEPPFEFFVEDADELEGESQPDLPTELPAEILNAPTTEPVFFIEDEADRPVDDAPTVAPVIGAAPSATPEAVDPVYAERRIEPPHFSWRDSLRRLAWQLLLWGLVGAALLQAAYVYRAQIALHAPFMRPALQSFCAYVGCQVPYLRALSAIDITYSRLSREARSADDGQQYLLQVGLNNTASVPQEWPTLLITFSDVSAAVIARLKVTPEQYLSAAQLKGPFLPGQVIDLRLQVEAQDTQINGFKVDKFFS